MKEKWHDFCWHWRHLICRRIIEPPYRWICGSHAPIADVMYELDILEDSLMYGGICYALPEDIPIDHRIRIGIKMLEYVRDYIRYNYMKDWSEK